MTTITTENIVNGVLRFQGSDTIKFLQGQLTCDVEQLSIDKGLPGAYCSPKGRIQASFIILMVADNDYLMLLPENQIDSIIETLSPYVAFFKCTMSNASEDWAISGIEMSDSNEQFELATQLWSVSHFNQTYAIKLPGKTQRWHCLSSSSLDPQLAELTKAAAFAWQISDMKSGMVWITESTRDKFLPHDLSLPTLGAVNFEKGCYTGQEIVARMHYRGKPKYKLAIIQTDNTDGEIADKLIQLIDNTEKTKLGQVVEKLKLDDESYLIVASVKVDVIEQKNIQLSLTEQAILCTINAPEY